MCRAVHELVDQLGRVGDGRVGLLPVVPERRAEAPGRLPLAAGGRVGGVVALVLERREVGVLLLGRGGMRAEPVVHHAVGHPRAGPRDQVLELGPRRVTGVVPQHRRLVPLDQLTPVRVGVRGMGRVVGDRGRQVLVVVAGRWRGEREIEAPAVEHPELQAPRADRVGQFTHHVALGLPVLLRGMGVLARPEQETVLVLHVSTTYLTPAAANRSTHGRGSQWRIPARNSATNAS